tara:strand:+ start:661 stop:936 length:276 start_codon:yes stop_codon:yes gene_type:complete
MQIGKIISEIHNMGSEDLNKVVEAVKYARSQAHRQTARSLNVGDMVEFDGRHGVMMVGHVKKINIKYVVVSCTNGEQWRVPAGHLRVRKAA